jgi:uncharacterized protein YdhG (YjbR/CyaY superfamily)
MGTKSSVRDPMNSAEIDRYIERFPPQVQALLKKMRATVRKAAPRAAEKIAYGVPTYVLNGNLVHFAAFRKHIGFYPGPAGIEAFRKDIEKKYKWAKGSVQFPFDEPLPLALVTRITKFRVKQNLRSEPPGD